MNEPTTPNATNAPAQSNDPSNLARRLAETLIRKLDLIETIRSWNADELALLATVEHVRCSVIYEEERLETFDALVDEAEQRGVGPDFRMWLALLLDPILVSTSVAGVTTRCQSWAVRLLSAGPAVARAPTPFPSDEAMIAWVLRHMDALRHVDAPIFAGPTGEEVIEAGAERLVLTQALRAELRLGIQEGWLRR